MERLAAPSASFAEIYAKYATFMKRVAISKFRLAAEDADELVHDVFATYLGHAPEDVVSLRAYLLVAICRAARRRFIRRRSEEHIYIAPTDDGNIPDAALERKMMLRMEVADALTACSPRCRELLFRHHMQGETAEEIARSLSTTAQYVRQQLSSCRKGIRERSRGTAPR